jgi:hypothetical protein
MFSSVTFFLYKKCKVKVFFLEKDDNTKPLTMLHGKQLQKILVKA